GGRARVEVSERGRRCGEAVPAQRRVMPLGGGAGRGEQRREIDGAGQMADSPVSPVRIRIASSMGSTKTLPSPIEPVLAAPAMIDVTLSTRCSPTTTSVLNLGRKSTVYCDPR